MIRAFLSRYWQLWRTVRRKVYLFLFAVFVIWYVDCLPDTLFTDSTSTVLLDRDGRLLNATIAEDGQWRFASCDTVPFKIASCLIEFEDREFMSHGGVDYGALGRAFFQNISNGRRVSGASTISMQVIRLMEKNPSRTYLQKAREMCMATRLEWSYSKQEILAMYASNAPFGGNVVGIDAAAWRYFNRSAKQLSWAESATLAVLPNAPGLIHPGKNRDALIEKRNRLLRRLEEKGLIDQTELELALIEPIPDQPVALPQMASHLLQEFIAQGKKGQTIQSTLDFNLQDRITDELNMHHSFLMNNRIENGAVIVASVKTGEVLSYVGNVSDETAKNESFVNCANAPRSSGSILKPILFAKSLEAGIITPNMLLPDVPSKFGNFSPVNFAETYDGLVPAHDALARSLNIPFVHLLNEYGLGKFHRNLKQYGFETVNRSPKHYGLSLVLGGAEVSLTNVTNAYLCMAQELNSGQSNGLQFDQTEQHESISARTNPAALYEMFEAMSQLKRPGKDAHWEFFDSSRKIAWKTGTSFGFRDAWAIAVTPDYVVAVWVGNADGEGRPGLTGFEAAAPLLFRVVNQLPKKQGWFKAPHADQTKIDICEESGLRASVLCPHTVQRAVPTTCLEKSACAYHQRIHVDPTGTQRVTDACVTVDDMKHPVWFILPPLNALYYQRNHPNYQDLPPWMEGCKAEASNQHFRIIYPTSDTKVQLSRDLDGSIGSLLLEATCRTKSEVLHWHLDDHYLGSTNIFHQLEAQPDVGEHVLTLVDVHGNQHSILFEVVE